MIELPNRPAWVYCQNCYSISHTAQTCPMEEHDDHHAAS
jgi:hypothetical protein